VVHRGWTLWCQGVCDLVRALRTPHRPIKHARTYAIEQPDRDRAARSMGDQWGRAPTAGQSFGDARQPSFSTQGPASAYPASSPGVNAGRSYTPPSVYSNAGPAPAQPRPGSVYILKAGPKAGSEMAPVVPQVTAAPTIAIERILDGLREQLKTRGAVGVLGLSRNFRILDRDKRGSLDSTEFARLVQMCRLEMTDAEVSLLFTRFDSDGNGCIDFGEFLESVRGAMPPCRRNLIAKVFHALDTLGDGNGVLELGDIQNAFDARSSPEVLAGRKSEREVLTEFLNGFEGLKGNHDGRVSFEEWLGYYEELSASMESDDAFGAMVVSAWSALKTIDANGREVPVIRYTATRAVDELERMMRVKIWQKSTRAKNERKTLEGAFKQFDSDGSLMISLAEFAKAMERFGLYASPDQIESLFNRYDADADGKVSPAEFMQILEVADEVQGLQIGRSFF